MSLKRRFSVKILFQYRVVTNGIENKRRVCEERIIMFFAKTNKDALSIVRKYGKKEQDRYTFDHGKRNRGVVYFEYIGIMDFYDTAAFGPEDGVDEVWAQYVEKREPMEKKEKILLSSKDMLRYEFEIRNRKGCVKIP